MCSLSSMAGRAVGWGAGVLVRRPEQNQQIFSLYVTGSLNIVLSSEHQHEIRRHIYNHQNEDGGWGTHVWGPSNMFGSCLNYVALRLLGEMLDSDNDALTKGRSWILSHGSATAVPQWGKIFLSIIGVYDWSGNNPIIPELWLLPYFLPIHPGRFWCFCRLVYMSMAYLYGKKFVGPITPTITALRGELYNVPYNNVDWGKACNYCAKEDLHNPRSQNKDGSFSAYERRRTTTWLEILNPSESFKNIVIDYPSSECTASTVDALVLFKELYPQHRSKEIGKCIASTVKFVEGKQLNDGSCWGICFTYGTLFAVKGLVVAGRNYYNSSSIRKACNFLLSKQQSTGGWGESYLSNHTEVLLGPVSSTNPIRRNKVIIKLGKN